ncbi:MAG TPA: LamG-like jellyroll fold domain-containing protein [Sedimentisphaerales bacterium]|nr:LamG-like jellyroll fold domain-containing protein [Sedimentisphaerales bacterium]
MCKKLMFLVCFVLVPVLSLPGLAADLNVNWPDTHTVTGTEEYDDVNCCGGTIIVGAGATLTVNGGSDIYGDGSHTGTLDVDGGFVSVGGHLEIGGIGVGHARICGGGVINTHTFGMRAGGGTGTMEICCGGMLVVDGDAAAQIQGYVDHGWITCPEPECSEVLVDYDNINPGKTTVKCVQCEKAWNPNPVDDGNCVEPDVVLSWSPGLGAMRHQVYFGVDFDAVSNATKMSPEYKGEQEANIFDLGWSLPCPGRYYWRTDEVCWDEVIMKGDVWSFTTCCCVDPPEGMTAWWPLDEKTGSTAMDIEGYDNEATYVGAPQQLEGKVDYALSFNGSTDYLQAADHPELNFGARDNLTIDAWIWLEDSNNGSIVAKRGGGPGYELRVNGSGLLTLLLEDGWESYWAESDYAVPTGQWSHVAATLERLSDLPPYGGPVRLYINGQAAGSSMVDCDGLSGTDPLWIGRSPFGYFEGKIDEVEIYRRALGADEIKAIFDAGSKGKCKCPTRTYDDVSDWNEGEFTGTKVGAEDCNGCLMLLEANDPCAATAFDYAWIANASEGTVSKINTMTGKEEARYYTGPPWNGGYSYLSPSRTAVDAVGNCWVANRNLNGGCVQWDKDGNCIKRDHYQGSVTKILLNPPPQGTTSKDNDSVGSPGHGIINSYEMYAWGKDVAVVRHYLVGGNMKNDSCARALAFDHNGNLWVGLFFGKRCLKVDPDAQVDDQDNPATFSPGNYPTFPYTAAAQRPEEVDQVYIGYTAYGMAVSPNGKLYVSTWSDTNDGRLVEIDPGDAPGEAAQVCQTLNTNGRPYGIAVDANCIVWMGDLYTKEGNRCIRWDPAQGFTYPTGASGRTRGVTVHPDGRIWLTCDLVDKVARFNSALPYSAQNFSLPTSPVGKKVDLPVGIGVDRYGDIIVVGMGSNNWCKLNPGTGANIATGGPQQTGPHPYTYSDFTGNLANQGTQQGFWRVIFDSGVPGQQWGTVSWTSITTPPDTWVKVWARAANAEEDLENRDYMEVQDGVPFGGVSGRFIQVRVKLSRSRPAELGDCNGPCADFPNSPKLCSLTVDANCGPCRIICPNDIFVKCDNVALQGAWVDLQTPQLSGDCNGAELQCNFDSPHFFPVGVNKVTCSAEDMEGNLVECYYYVTVVCPNDANGACCYRRYDRETQQSTLYCKEGVTEKDCNEAYNGVYLGEGSNCDNASEDCPNCVAVPYDAVAWWPLDEETGPTARDIAGFNNEGTYVGSPTPTPAIPPGEGLVDRALMFDGYDDYLEVDDHAEINFGIGDLSIDAWVKTDNDFTPFLPIVDKRTEESGYAFFLHYGYLAFALADPVTPGFAEFIAVGPDAFVADDSWHNVVATLDRDSSTGLNLYVDDGSPVGTFNASGKSGSLTNAAKLRIGGGYGISGPATYFEGILDEVEMFDRVLEDEEIVKITDADDSGKCKEYAHVTRFMSCCPDKPGIMVLTICNFTGFDHQYAWNAQGVFGPGCDFAGPYDSGQVWVEAGQCESAEISFNCGSGMSGLLNVTSCCHVTVQNMYSKNIIASIGTLRASRWCGGVLPWKDDPYWRPTGPVPFIYFPDGNGPSASMGFEVTNIADACGILDYKIMAMVPDDGPDDEFILLDGYAPGTTLEGSVPVALGETVELPVDVAFAEYEGSVFIDIVLLAADGDGNDVPIASQAVRCVLCTETTGDMRARGDLDLNCRVQMYDFGLLASAWLSQPGDPEYNPEFDIGIPADDIIDWKDLAVIGENWLYSALWP